jgi:RNA polymerase sigma factor (TIGR02999 family)
MSDVTRLLNVMERGDGQAADELLPLVYEQLRRLAAREMSRERPGQTLQATALVHEAYLRLVDVEGQSWSSRAHFFRTAAEAMRRILVENARRKKSLKSGGDRKRAHLNEATVAPGADWDVDDLIALDEALQKFSQKDKTKADLVKLRFFAGLTIEQSAEFLGISPATAKRYWIYARAWLIREVG